MAYERVSAVLFFVLIIAPVLVSVGAGLGVHRRGRREALKIYLGAGAFLALVYAFLAPPVVNWLVPPPYDPTFAGGRGLDLRGVGLVIAGWLGGAAGLVATVVSFTVYWLRSSKARTT